VQGGGRGGEGGIVHCWGGDSGKAADGIISQWRFNKEKPGWGLRKETVLFGAKKMSWEKTQRSLIELSGSGELAGKGNTSLKKEYLPGILLSLVCMARGRRKKIREAPWSSKRKKRNKGVWELNWILKEDSAGEV